MEKKEFRWGQVVMGREQDISDLIEIRETGSESFYIDGDLLSKTLGDIGLSFMPISA